MWICGLTYVQSATDPHTTKTSPSTSSSSFSLRTDDHEGDHHERRRGASEDLPGESGSPTWVNPRYHSKEVHFDNLGSTSPHHVKSVVHCISSSTSCSPSSSRSRHVVPSSKSAPRTTPSSRIPHYTRHPSSTGRSSSSSQTTLPTKVKPVPEEEKKKETPRSLSSCTEASPCSLEEGGGRGRRHHGRSSPHESPVGRQLSSMGLQRASEIPRKRLVSTTSSSSLLFSPCKRPSSSSSSSRITPVSSSSSSSSGHYLSRGRSPVPRKPFLKEPSLPDSVSSFSEAAMPLLLVYPSSPPLPPVRLCQSAPAGDHDHYVYHDCRSLDRASRIPRPKASLQGGSLLSSRARKAPSAASSSVSRRLGQSNSGDSERGKKRKIDYSLSPAAPECHADHPGLSKEERNHEENVPCKTNEGASSNAGCDSAETTGSFSSTTTRHADDGDDGEKTMARPPARLSRGLTPCSSSSSSSGRDGGEGKSQGDSNTSFTTNNSPISHPAMQTSLPSLSPLLLESRELDLLHSSSPSFLSLPASSSSSLCSTNSERALPPSPELPGEVGHAAEGEGKYGSLGDLSPPLIPSDFFLHQQHSGGDYGPREVAHATSTTTESPEQRKTVRNPSLSSQELKQNRSVSSKPQGGKSSILDAKKDRPRSPPTQTCQPDGGNGKHLALHEEKKRKLAEETRSFLGGSHKDDDDRKKKQQSSSLRSHATSTDSERSSRSSIPSPTLFVVSAQRRLKHQHSKQ